MSTFELKTELTPRDKLLAAATKVVYNTRDAEIGLILGVTNDGRVNEGIKEVLGFLGLAAPGYKQRNEDTNGSNTVVQLAQQLRSGDASARHQAGD